MYSRCLLLSLPAAPLTFPPHNKRAPLNALYGVKVGVLESCHLIGSEDFAIPQSLTCSGEKQRKVRVPGQTCSDLGQNLAKLSVCSAKFSVVSFT